MPYLLSTSFGGAGVNATTNTDFQKKLVAFITGLSNYHTDTTFAGGVRLRYMKAKAAAVAETWTVVCTNGGTGAFSVTGSVSGAQTAATVGTPYSNTYVSFSLLGLNGLAVTGDTFSFTVTPTTLTVAGYAWELYKYDSVTATAHVRGLGNAGVDRIYVSVRAYMNVPSDIYNLAFNGGTAFLETASYVVSIANQSSDYHLSLWNNTIPYVFIADGRHFKAIAKVSTGDYESLFAGFILPTGTPSEYPYPLYIGATSGTTAIRYSDATITHSAFWQGYNSGALYRKSGVWNVFSNYTSLGADSVNNVNSDRVIPTNDFILNKTIDGSYVIYPVSMISTTIMDCLGDIPGLFYISGYTQAAENIATVGGVNHFVFQNCARNGVANFACFKLE